MNHSKFFYDTPFRIRKNKTKINQWDQIPLESICTAKETIRERERQPSEWEQRFANEDTPKELYLQIVPTAHTAQYPTKQMTQ